MHVSTKTKTDLEKNDVEFFYKELINRKIKKCFISDLRIFPNKTYFIYSDRGA